MKPIALITGSSGGIGTALTHQFLEAGYDVIGMDLIAPANETRLSFLQTDLIRFSREQEYREEIVEKILRMLPNARLHVLINNAALQIVAPTSKINAGDWNNVMDTNVTAPFLLIKSLANTLERGRGSVLNIASIHAQLTKPGFVAYATSKAALVGMTRALAVDIGDRVRVNAISPAAIATPMLVDGLKSNPGALQRLGQFHPAGGIGTPEEIARFAFAITSEQFSFLNGAILGFDGGISGRLHDPE